MSQRQCEGCRWFRFDMLYHGRPHGVCRRNPPVAGEFPEVHGDSMCGEWSDKNITPEQHERRELAARFAVAIIQGTYANPESNQVNFVMESQRLARDFCEADAEGQQ